MLLTRSAGPFQDFYQQLLLSCEPHSLCSWYMVDGGTLPVSLLCADSAAGPDGFADLGWALPLIQGAVCPTSHSAAVAGGRIGSERQAWYWAADLACWFKCHEPSSGRTNSLPTIGKSCGQCLCFCNHPFGQVTLALLSCQFSRMWGRDNI